MTDLSKSEQKRQAEREARASMFAKRDDRPAATDLSALGVTVEEDAPAEQAAPAPAEPPAHPQAAISTEIVETPAPVTKTPQNAVKRVAPKAKPVEDAPWKNANPRISIPFTTRFPEELHMKLQYLKSKMPNTSLQKIVLQAVDEKVAELLAEYYDGEV